MLVDKRENILEDLFNKKEIKSIDNKEELILGILKVFKSKLSKTQIQKLLFLLEVEEEIKLPFNFFKYNYGPYSKIIATELNKLEKERKISISNISKKNYFGESYLLKEIELLIDKIDIDTTTIKLLNNIKSKYNNSASSLTSTCYDDYDLKYKGESEKSYLERINNEINNIKVEVASLNKAIEDNKSFSKKEEFELLTNLDYLTQILEKDLFSIDMVERGIILNKITHFISLLRIFLFENESSEKNILNILSNKFSYIVYKVTNLNLIDDIFEDYVGEV